MSLTRVEFQINYRPCDQSLLAQSPFAIALATFFERGHNNIMPKHISKKRSKSALPETSGVKLPIADAHSGTEREDAASMSVQLVLSEYLEGAIEQAEYDKLSDGTFAGRIRGCPGVVAFGSALRDCERELRSTLEDWLLLGLKLGHPLPIVRDIDLNKDLTHATVEPV